MQAEYDIFSLDNEFIENPDTHVLTWIGTKGSRIKRLWYPKTALAILDFTKHNKFSVIGNGSNVLLGNLDHCLISTKSLQGIQFDKDKVIAGAGVNNLHLVQACLKYGLCGFEFLYTIPGTIGGAAAMNAGAHGHEVKDYIHSVEYVKNGEISLIARDQIQFDYRWSQFLNSGVVTRVLLNLSKANPEKVVQYSNYVNTKQPRDFTLGSTFKNPKTLTSNNSTGFKALRAWELLEKCNECELSSANAYFSKLHRNFIINSGTATTIEVYQLINKARQAVLRHTGILLENEVQLLGEFETKSPRYMGRSRGA